MSETKWTKGPWKAQMAKTTSDGEFDFAVLAPVDGKTHVIAEAFGRVGETTYCPARHNAHLIAAAPDLYEALATLLAEMRAMAERSDLVCDDEAEAMLVAERALSRARGETE